jgi:hypothetical protein
MHHVGVLCPVFQKKLTDVQATNYFHCQDPIAKDMLINAFGLEICICDSHSIRKSYYHTVYYTQPAATGNNLYLHCKYCNF